MLVPRRRFPIATPLLALLVCTVGRAAAAPFPPVTERELALASVPGEPNAPAVVLFKKGEFRMMDIARGDVSSSLKVDVRVKVLTEQGKERGEVAIPHSRALRLLGFEGRTVLPDGRVVPLPADAKFESKASRAERRFVTTVAFPAVEVGAILDYRYELRFDSIYLLEPWYFSEDLPVLYSEIVYQVPSEIAAQPWGRDPFRVQVKSESAKNSQGVRFRAWAENLPAIPEEPYGAPFADLATQLILLPSAYTAGPTRFELLADWRSTSELVLESWNKALRKDGAAARRARELAARAGTGTAEERAAAVYRFVRDEIATEDLAGVYVPERSTPDSVLAARAGDYAEKALLLQAMLAAIEVPARPVWVADRLGGLIDRQLANPNWFERVIVAAEIGGRRVFLDPSDRALAFGRIHYGIEGMEALIPDRKKPENLVLPESPWTDSRRRASLELALGADGRLAGKGALELTGHHAWNRIQWQENAEKTAEAWKKWLGDAWRDFEIADLAFEELADESRVRVTWSMAQREEEVLGDEATLAPSRPLGPAEQPFVQPATARRTPVVLSFADRDEVELRLSWPEGWKVETAPSATSHESAVGALVAEVEVDEAARSLVYRRRFDILDKELGDPREYELIRALYTEVEKHDAQSLALVRR